jgi:hypothetical protein
MCEVCSRGTRDENGVKPQLSYLTLLLVLLPLLPVLSPWLQAIWQRLSTCLGRNKKRQLTFESQLAFSAWHDDPFSTVRCFAACLWEWQRENKMVNCASLKEESISKSIDRRMMEKHLGQSGAPGDDKHADLTLPIFVDGTTVRAYAFCTTSV